MYMLHCMVIRYLSAITSYLVYISSIFFSIQIVHKFWHTWVDKTIRKGPMLQCCVSFGFL